MKLKRRSTERELDALAQDAADETASDLRTVAPIRFDRVVSTGSTLLDLAISGGRVRGGGLPPGILVEVYGPSGSGKTSVLAEICGSAQRRGGKVRFRDPEARLDQEYARIYGVNIAEDFFDYSRPNTVKELFDDLWGWNTDFMSVSTEEETPKRKFDFGDDDKDAVPEKKKWGGKKKAKKKKGVVELLDDKIHVYAADSIAALSTELEMEDWDKRGQKQAKEFSQGLRKSARLIGQSNKLVVFTNQLRQGDKGEVTTGGKALEFYSSLRIRVGQKEVIEREAKLKSGKAVSKAIGIESTCYVKKSTVDDPYRTAPLYIMFNRGIDDVRANLQWYKDMMKEGSYNCIDKTYNSMDKALEYVAESKLQKKIRRRTIALWEEVESLFKQKRMPVVRF